MMEFLTAGPNLPFTIALSLMFTIALIEVIGTLMGAGLSDLLNSILPDTDIDVSLDGPEVETPSVLSSLLGWLLIGQVPIMILFVVFLTTFGLIGLFIQTMTLSIMGSMLPAFVVSIPAFIQHLAETIRESVKPLEQIDSIKIVQVDGLGGSGAATHGDGHMSGRESNLADQVINSALRYRAQAPLLDSLLREIGIIGGDINGLTSALLGQKPVPQTPEKDAQRDTTTDKE